MLKKLFKDDNTNDNNNDSNNEEEEEDEDYKKKSKPKHRRNKQKIEQDVYKKLIYDWQPFILNIFSKNSDHAYMTITNKNYIHVDPKFFENKILKYHYNDILDRKINENYWRLFDYFILGSDIPNILLNLCYVAKSKIQGKGVFANCDIAKNSLITLMPNHIMIFNNIYWYHPIYYNNVPYNSFLHDDKEKLFETYSIECYNSEICGDPNYDNNSAYLGHLINDGIGPFHKLNKHDKKKLNQQVEKIYSEDNLALKTNVEFICWKHFPGIYVKSTKNIKKNEELLISYGKGYWLRRYKIKHNIK